MSTVITGSTADALLQMVWDEKLQKYIEQGDPLSGMAGMVSGTLRAPEACVYKVTLKPKQGQYILKLRMPLAGSGYVGGSQLTENVGERMRLKTMRSYIEEYGHVVNLNTKDTVQGFLAGDDIDPNAAHDAMSDWAKYRSGKLKRQALVQLFDSNLVNGGMWGLSFGLNQNIFVDGVGAVAFDSTLLTYQTNLYNALFVIPYGAGGFDETQGMQADTLNTMQTFVRFKRKIAAPQGDYEGKIPMLIHPYANEYLSKLSSLVSLQGLRRTTLSESIAKMAYSAGADRGEINDFSLMTDPRAPIAVLNSEAGTVTFVYRDVGEIDQRDAYVNTAVQRVFCINIGLGKGALVHSQALQWKYADQLKDIGRLQQIRGGAIEGFNARNYDESVSANAGETTNVQQYSFLHFTQSGKSAGVPA